MTGTRGLSAYIAVTAAYWAFMLTDGALRMLVLLHFHQLGFSPVQLAYLFLLYEVMGIVTNLGAGWLAARFGLTSTLYAGLGLQIIALLMLTQLDAGWAVTASVIFVMLVQGLSGVAKDLAKMSSKSAVKLLAPEADGALFRWVSWLTGSKNAVKGLGFLAGATLLATIGYAPALYTMAAALTLVLLAILLFMPTGLPAGNKKAKITSVWSRNPQINTLSLARLFLFGARDTWFVVGIPIYFYAVLSDGTPEGNRAAFFLIGTFMACWIIGYGAIQAAAPNLLRTKTTTLSDTVSAAKLWVGVLVLIPLALSLASFASAPGLTPIIVTGLLVFGAVFALNSALHSYLILAFSQSDRVTMDVGFYYMANAAGRLTGTLLSGVSYQLFGVTGCLATAALMALASAVSLQKLSPTSQTA